jgi:hypothetical protein
VPRLIAACRAEASRSAKLLEAAQQVVADYRGSCGEIHGEVIRRLEEVIAKATAE